MKSKYLVFISLFFSVGVFAQNMNNVDLTKLTPEQIQMYKQLTTKTTGVNNNDYDAIVKRGLADDSLKIDEKILERRLKSRVFGAALFSNQKLTFEPKLNIPTPRNYILGTYDEVLIDISGLYDANYKLKVSPEGNIRIPNVGMVKVSGRTIEDVTRTIKNEISKYFQGVNSGETRINVTLGDIRSIKVAVVGDAVKPGTYTLPSLATAFNALYACGGPTETGSMRSVKVIRAGKVISVLDVYGMLVEGINVNDISLQDGDILRIEPYKNRVIISGSMKRTGIFETVAGENIQKVLDFAGGFTEKANKTKLQIFRYTSAGRTELDLTANQFVDFIPISGDSVYVSRMFQDQQGYSVTISGEVKKPGKYSLVENVRLKDLILRAQGFTDKAYIDSVEVIRAVKNKKDLIFSNDKSLVYKIKIDRDLNNLDESTNLKLENGDQIVVRKIPGFEEIRMVRVEGEVKVPGEYNIKNKTERISDVLTRAGGLTNFAYSAGAFLIRTESPNEIEQKLNQIIRTNSLNQLSNKQSKTLDMNTLKNSGANAIESLELADSLQKKLSGYDAVDKIFSNENVVGIDVDLIMNNKGSASDLKLEEGDIIYIPREQQTVKVVGQVLFPTIVRYDETFGLKNYIYNSGGLADNASRNNIFVLYANGNVKGTKKFLFFRTYPKIEPGCQIVVPEKPLELKNKMSVGESVGLLTSVSSTLVLIYTILKSN